MRNAFAPGTYKNLKSQWKDYFIFASYFGFDPYHLNVQVLVCYLQLLFRSYSSYSTIVSHVSAVKTLFSLLNLPVEVFQHVKVKLTLKGIKKSLGVSVKKACPVNYSILLQVYKVIDWNNALDVTLWASFLFMFFLMLRSSQLFPRVNKDVYVQKILRRKDVVIKGAFCFVNIYWTKTIQAKEKKLKFVLSRLIDSPFCPVKAYERMCCLVTVDDTQPAFGRVNVDYIPITYNFFVKKMRLLFKRAGLSPELFSSHSFRRGGATCAFEKGVPDYLIKTQGDWASDAYQSYLDVSVSQRLDVFHLMTSDL